MQFIENHKIKRNRNIVTDIIFVISNHNYLMRNQFLKSVLNNIFFLTRLFKFLKNFNVASLKLLSLWCLHTGIDSGNEDFVHYCPEEFGVFGFFNKIQTISNLQIFPLPISLSLVEFPHLDIAAGKAAATSLLQVTMAYKNFDVGTFSFQEIVTILGILIRFVASFVVAVVAIIVVDVVIIIILFNFFAFYSDDTCLLIVLFLFDNVLMDIHK